MSHTFSESTVRLQKMIDVIEFDGPLDADPNKQKPFMPVMLCLKKEMQIANDGFKLARKETLKHHMMKENRENQIAYVRLGLANISTAV